MKFDVSQIVGDYFRSLRGDRWTLYSIVDVVVLFMLPLAAAVGTFWIQSAIQPGFYLSLFTLFGVFIAIFMAVLGVLVPLYHAPRKVSADPVVDSRYVAEHDIRLRLIYELSAALNYLMLLCLVSMAILMVPIAVNTDLFLFKWVSVALGLHLIMNFLVILKRVHALFNYEFSHET